MTEDQLLQVPELAELVQVRVVDDQVETHVCQVHLFHDVVEFRPR